MHYVFGNPGPAWTERDHALANLLQRYWVQFARTGNPNGGDLSDWPRLDPSEERALAIQDGRAFAQTTDVSKLRQLDQLFERLRRQ
jgi:para-nitrobenzyl esterase